MRKIYVILIGSAIMALIASCGWVMPEEVQIVGKPAYELPAGSTTIDLTEFFDMRSMLTEALSGDFGEPNIYENDEGAFTFEVEQDLIEFDPSEFAEDGLDLDAIDQVIDEQTFSVPDMNQSIPIEVNLDPIDLPAGAEIAAFTQPAPEADGETVRFDGETVDPLDADPIPITATGFTSVTFSEGFLDISLDISNETPGMTVSIHETQLLRDADGSLIATAQGDGGTATGADIGTGLTLRFDLTDIEFPADIQLSFYMTVDGGTLGQSFDLNVAPAFVGAKVQAAAGVDFQTDPETITETISNPLPENIQQVTIGTGSIDIEPVLPGTWSGVDLILSAVLQVGTEPVQNFTDNGDGTLSLDLAGTTIRRGDDITVEITITVDGNNATIEFTEDPEISGATSLEITEFSEVVLDAEEMDFSQNIGILFDEEIRDLINAINLVAGSEELSFSITNGLPTDIEVTLVSQTLLNSVAGPPQYTETLTFAGNSDTADEQVISLDQTIDFANLEEDVEDAEGAIGTGIKLELQIAMTGYDDATKTLTLTNVVPNETYSFSGSVTFAPEIESIELSPTLNSSTMDEPQDPLDFSMIADFLPPGVTISGIEGYLTIRGSDLSGNLVMIGHYNEGADILVLAGGAYGGPEGEETNPEHYTAVPFEAGDDIAIDLETLINTGSSDLVIEYFFDIDALTIQIAELDEESEPITIGMRLVVPLQLMVPEGGVVWTPLDEDGNPMLAIDEDLFGRESIEAEDDEVAKLLQQVESVSLNYGLVNDSGLNMAIRMKQGDFEKQIGFDTADHQLEFTSDDFLFLREHFFMPDIDILLPGGLMPVNPEVEVTVNLWMSLKTNIDYTFPITGDL